MPVGRWVRRMADSVLLTCWPPAPPARRVSIFEVRLVDRDVDLLGLGKHRDGRRRGVDASRRLGVRDALHAVHAGLEFELGEGAASLDLGDDLLEAADRAFARRDHLDLPLVERRIALVHAEQVAGEQRGLVAAGPGADFQNHVALVHRVLRDQRDADLLRERGAFFLQRRLLGFGERAHLRIGRGVGEHRVEIGDLALRGAVGRDRLHQRLQLGELARQPHIGVALGTGGELGLDRLEARHQRIELLFGQVHRRR